MGQSPSSEGIDLSSSRHTSDWAGRRWCEAVGARVYGRSVGWLCVTRLLRNPQFHKVWRHSLGGKGVDGRCAVPHPPWSSLLGRLGARKAPSTYSKQQQTKDCHI